MNLPTETGRYIAAFKKWGITESGSNNIPTFAAEFDLMQWWDGTAWVDVSKDQLEISGWFYLFKKDGQPNTFTITALKDAMGWNGVSLPSLNDDDWSQTEVQLTIEFEEYNGKSKIKVKFINHRDSTPGGVDKADPQTMQSLESRYGAALRALNGGTAKSNGSPKPATPKTAAAPANQVDAAKKEAWSKFLVKWNEFVGEQPEEAANKNERWKSAVTEYFGPVEPTKISAVQWKEFATMLEKDCSPATGIIPF